MSFKCNITLFRRLFEAELWLRLWRLADIDLQNVVKRRDDRRGAGAPLTLQSDHHPFGCRKMASCPRHCELLSGISRQMLPPADAEHCLATPRWPACFNFLSSRVQKLRGLFGWGLEPDHWTKIFTGIFLEDVTLLWHKWSQTFILNKSSGNNFKLKATFPTSFKQ